MNIFSLMLHGFGLQRFGVRHIADQFAREGYFVLIPDLFYRDPIPEFRDENFSIDYWERFHRPEGTGRIVNKMIQTMRDTLGCKRIGGVGYSFGGDCLCQYLERGKLDVGFIAHPNYLDTELLATIEGPLSLASGARDSVFTTADRHEAELILEEIKYPYQITVYSHVGHGFSGNGNPWVTVQRFGMEQSFQQALVWFDEYLKKD
ncbi:uncharacterized protein N7483_008310 [Penicillium malachiteum]|uniref:uncharacterized protein n=1 Tax=Penicillium malachiteum TaxID=1324776 RepID=UPI002546C64A|nr:uncharacterized protein N7483_008310 [Penicillium malachiteum]KAJ5720376.1 hypothetical protein N7483_008310 [Penicillium malachiteum]